MKSTCESFWRMVQENEVSLIIALCPEEEQNKVKLFRFYKDFKQDMCYRYYESASEDTNLEFGDINLNLVQKKNVFDGMIKRKILQTSSNLETQAPWKVTHLQELKWPDNRCPQYGNLDS